MSLRCAACIAFVALAGCDKLGWSGSAPPESHERPGSEELKSIAYLPQKPAPGTAQYLYDHLDRARSCRDLELATRWNRPPDIPSGPFHKKLLYVSGGVPGAIPKDTEVFFAGRIEKGESLPSGDAGWIVRLRDGTALQAVEAAETWQRQEQDEESHTSAALVKPYIAGRALCGHGVYQRQITLPGRAESMPLISMLFVMDRSR